MQPNSWHTSGTFIWGAYKLFHVLIFQPAHTEFHGIVLTKSVHIGMHYHPAKSGANAREFWSMYIDRYTLSWALWRGRVACTQAMLWLNVSRSTYIHASWIAYKLFHVLI